MLQEMGVAVWWPAADAVPIANQQLPAPQEAPSSQPPEAIASRAQTAISAAPLIGALPSDERHGRIARMHWPDLQQAVHQCQDCGLCAQRKNTVFGTGPTSVAGSTGAPTPVDWLVVGEAPGEQEDLRGIPFVGPAGQLLDNMLKAVRLRGAGEPALGRQQGIYITNVIKCRPPGNRNPQAAEIAQCLPYLARQISLLQPRLILALGRFAADALLMGSQPGVSQMPLGKLRGQVYAYQGIPVVVSYHPAYLLRNPPDKAKAWADLCLAVQVYQEKTG